MSSISNKGVKRNTLFLKNYFKITTNPNLFIQLQYITMMLI